MNDLGSHPAAKLSHGAGEAEVLSDTGEILSDQRRNGRERPWQVSKSQSLLYAAALKRLGYDKKAERVEKCGSFLVFLECLFGHWKRLCSASFCKDRFCIMCAWRKCLIISSQVFTVAHAALDRYPTYRFILLTLTIPNTDSQELSGGVDTLLKGWDRLIKRAEVKKVVTGYFRALEVTYNGESNTWHPHIHAMLFVPAGYFKKDYIKRDRWLELWQESTRIPSITQVDLRPIKNKGNTHDSLAAAAAEVVKYAVKPGRAGTNHPYLRATDDLTSEAVIHLLAGLKGRRLTQFGGLFRELHRELNLADVDDKNVDLVHTDDHVSEATGLLCSVCGKPLVEHLYKWDRGLENYVG